MPPKRPLDSSNKENIWATVIVGTPPPRKQICRRRVLSNDEARQVQAEKIAERLQMAASPRPEPEPESEPVVNSSEMTWDHRTTEDAEFMRLKERKQLEAAEKTRMESEKTLSHILETIKAHGWSVGRFLEVFLSSNDQKHSSMATQTLQRTGVALISQIKQRARVARIRILQL
jgi:hypothetical protein